MKKSILSLGVLLILAAPISVQATDSGWVKETKLYRVIRKLQRQNIRPTGMACRADPSKKTFQGQVRLSWNENSKGKNWIVNIVKSQLNWKPTGSKHMKKKYAKTLVMGGGGTKFRCSLWYTKNDLKNNYSNFKY